MRFQAIAHRPIQPSRYEKLLRLVVLGSLLMTFFTLPVVAMAAEEAVDDDPFDRPGFYVGVSGMWNKNFFDEDIADFLSDELGEDVDVDIEDSYGINARLGYRAASFFAVELEYEWVDSFDVDASADLGPPIGSLTGELYRIEGHTLTAQTKWIVPFWRVQPYLTLGVGYSYYDVDRGSSAAALEAFDPDIEIEGGGQHGFAGRVGGGLDLYLTQSILINAEVTAVLTTQDFDTPDEGNIDDLNYMSFSAGLQYRF